MIDPVLSVLPVILLFVLGYFLQRKQFFADSSIADLKKIVSTLGLPALLFGAFASLQFEAKYLLIVISVFSVCLLLLIFGWVLRSLLKIESEYFPLLLSGFEMGMLGYALFLSLYGHEHLGVFALIDLGQVLFVFFVLMGLLISKREGLQSKGQLLTHFISSPVIIAIFSGIAVSFLKPVIPEAKIFTSLSQFISFLGNLTVPLIALVVGYELSIKKQGLSMALRTIIIRKILLAALALVFNLTLIRNVLGLPKIYEYAVFTMFMLPPPFVISIYMKQDDKRNLEYVVNTLSLSTVVSVVFVILVSVVY